MKFVDEAKIFIKAGNGGQGCVSFRRAKFIPKGGPDGGDGGKGGDIILVGKRGLSSLVELKYKKIYKAENGKNGSGNNKKGRNGKDIYISVPLGTIVYNLDNPIIPLYDVAEDEKGYVVARGGRGGRGNTRFATSTNRTPVQFDFGGEGEEMAVHLVLKLLADIGIVGLPNTGKSTLISKLTDAKPQIGDYPFTTLIPTLGVMTNNDKTFVVADIPGIIEGASKGKGLGLMFLKHIERTKMLLLLLDLSSTNLEDDYSTILNELGSFNEEIVNKTASNKHKMNNKYLLIIAFLVSIHVDVTAQSLKRIEYLQLINEGDIALRFGKWDQAILHYTNAVDIDQNIADAYMKRAVLLRKMGRLQESLRDYNQAINLNPYSIYLYDQRAKLKILAMSAIDGLKRSVALKYCAILRSILTSVRKRGSLISN